MSRLTEGSACFMFCAGEREELGEDCSFYEVCFERQMYDKLKHYEDLEEAGKMIGIPETGIGDLSDGYHTFNELYHHRAVLFSVICNFFKSCAWKSKKHDDGTMYDGMFIVGIDTPNGSATYHYDIEPYWNMFDVKELDKAPEWDGHTPDDAINRIAGLSKTNRLIELPCVMGDTVYQLVGDEIAEMKVRTIAPYGSPRNVKDRASTVWNVYMESDYTYAYKTFYDFGKTVFLIKEEAEAKLAEIKARPEGGGDEDNLR